MPPPAVEEADPGREEEVVLRDCVKTLFCSRGERRNEGLYDLRVGDLGDSRDRRRFSGDLDGASSSGMVGGGKGMSVRSKFGCGCTNAC